MIDEKKIEEATNIHLEEVRNIYRDDVFGVSYPTESKDIEGQIMDDFREGVNWALQEFKKSLWYDVSKEPKDGSSFVYVDDKGEVWSYEDYHADNFDDSFHKGWLAAIDNLGVIKWCYINDFC